MLPICSHSWIMIEPDIHQYDLIEAHDYDRFKMMNSEQ